MNIKQVKLILNDAKKIADIYEKIINTVPKEDEKYLRHLSASVTHLTIFVRHISGGDLDPIL